MNQEDLSKQLNNFTISSNEEKLSQALDKAHLSSSSAPSIFSLPQRQQPPSLPKQQPIYNGDVQNKTNYIDNDTTSDWDPAATSNWKSTNNNNHHESEDGWGEGPPSYTSISQGTYFGFNSIMQSPDTVIANPSQLNNIQAFSRYKNMPVTFTSAAAEAANKE
ncbi:hypothetical protein INT46_005827 [Mucor plumbeus]|uniref:Uncharacterized protein n=1 Tax=Mucor plumbeus TaxID=97098 RepID=A0A8H7QRC4_9FUNG|nr:hypothetical protein INT46_005827 [Mucor plumbeus]